MGLVDCFLPRDTTPVQYYQDTSGLKKKAQPSMAESVGRIQLWLGAGAKVKRKEAGEKITDLLVLYGNNNTLKELVGYYMYWYVEV